MPIGITEEHEHLRTAVRRFVDDRIDPGVLREALEASSHDRPAFWDALTEPGWIGLHLAEVHGGSGVGLVEQAVVVEELGRACAPGPYVPTAIVAALLQADGGPAADALLPRIVSGELTGAVALDGATLVTGGSVADVIVCAVDGAWYALDAAEAGAKEVKSIDLTRRLARIDRNAATAARAAPERKLANLDDDRVRLIAATLFAAEAVGVAQWCVETASEYAKVRVQFGRPIGQFQGVKHRCAEMLARVELARAATWDAAAAADDLTDPGAPLAIAAAAALAFEAAFVNAKDCVQTLGGIGFTWEHDAHIYLRRAMTLHELTGTPDDWRVRAAQAAMHGARRRLAVDLAGNGAGDAADAFRAELREFLASTSALPPLEQRDRIAEAGYITPGWPAPWGRDAKALELLIIEEEFRAAKIPKPNIGVGGWALPNLIVHGTKEQQERWIMPTLRGEIGWCQLFSEPGAGSDLASLSTKATRVEGGWLLNGQKVWTSMAKEAEWGICLARTNADAAKHDGISCFMVDMKTPGIDIRPLRELTGMAMFNEVFFDDVFVPEDCLVGRENDGWRAARTTLANERVYMGSGNTIGGGVVGVLKAIEARGRGEDRLALAEAGDLVVTGHALSALGFRLTLAALAGADPSGSEAAVRKLLGVQHDQHVQEVGMQIAGIEAMAAEGDDSAWSASFLFNRCLTIAGGTSDVQRNVISERLLGLPRDP
ncbi:MAG: acyl-CoA dehydrogenase domain protein [Actinomycetia bacterium]|nr:acyl-CoA dehydrogenase domain protein [Actinomycetes bacterium]